MVAIIDDSSAVWNHSPNLLTAPAYEYFGDLEGEVNRNPGEKAKDKAKNDAGQRVSEALAIPASFTDVVTATYGEVVGAALEDAFLAELRCQLATEGEPDTALLDDEAEALLGCRSDSAAWIALARTAADGSQGLPPLDVTQTAARAVK